MLKQSKLKDGKDGEEKEKLPERAILPKLDMLAVARPNSIDDDTWLENVILEDLEFLSAVAVGVSIVSSIVRNVDLSNSKIKGFRMNDVEVEKMSLVNADLDYASIDRVMITGSRLTGVKLAGNGSSIRDVVFKGCKLDWSTLRFAKITSVRFENCVLSDSDFVGAELEDVTFSESDLSNADFSQAKMKRVDVSGSKIEGIKIAPQQLGGLMVDHSQALYVVQLMGVRVK